MQFTEHYSLFMHDILDWLLSEVVLIESIDLLFFD